MKKLKSVLVLLLCVNFFGCPSDDINEEEPQEEISITYEVLNFEYTLPTDTEGERLAYEIMFINNSTVDVVGAPSIKTKAVFGESEVVGSEVYHSQCNGIPANDNCVVSTDVTVPLEESEAFGYPDSIEFISAEYILD